MESIRKRPKGDFIAEANMEQLYTLTKHWNSDLHFFRDDLSFLHKLLDSYFIWIDKDENYRVASKMKNELLKLKERCQDLLDKTDKHRQQIGKMILEKMQDSRVFRLEHEHLEDEIAGFVKSFRLNRLELFKITEYIKDTDRVPEMS
ncbi:hypothetical protein [Salegentibacter salegens]|uniref:Uncharacterized protein n=1 Tax=Salegentibacter salegens TaxID=143223 RepID=A0A1M7NC38_9FLAO|nr:hypothetical protein [Salegentibacter salegens]PRX42951.1 hypothetical protein LY58_02640 [Salegentibacter salegens]SHN01210.1 hypothetical protein SAMN05878281_3023 [Salegentibacter salegens]